MNRRPKFEELESRRLLTAEWTNPWRPFDVNGDNSLTPIDALLGINRLNSSQSPLLPNRLPDSEEPYFDTNGDGIHSPVDVLRVINSLNGGLQVSVALSNDSGNGVGAGTDQLTNDHSILGEATGEASSLRARIEDGVWQDVSDLLGEDGLFELDVATVVQLNGSQLSDGIYRIEIEAGYEDGSDGLVDRAFVEFELDRTRPHAPLIGEARVTSPGKIEVVFDEELSAESIVELEVQAYDITWGEYTGDSPWLEEDQFPRFPITPTSVEVSTDSRKLLISLPITNRSARFLIELGEPVEDLAGNRSAARSFVANQFANSIPLSFGTSYRHLAQFEKRTTEYQFKLDSPESIVWTGNVEFGTVARFELYDHHGNLVKQLWPGTIQNPREAQRAALISLPAGNYFWRVVEPPGSLSHFRLYKASQLPNLPTSRSFGNPELWPLDAYSVELVKGERLFVEPLEDTSAIRSILDPLGREVTPELVGQNQLVDAPLDGNYTLLMNRIGYRVHRSIPDVIEVSDLTAPITGTLDTPGQVAIFSAPTPIGELYLLETDLDDGLSLEIERLDGRFIEFSHRQLITAYESQLRFRVTRLTEGPQVGSYSVKFNSASDAPDLPIDVDLPPPVDGELLWYRLPEGIVKFEGERLFRLIEKRSHGVSDRLNFGPKAFPQQGQSERLFLLEPSSDPKPWRAYIPSTTQRLLDFDSPNLIEFETGLEVFDFQFEGTADQFIALNIDAPVDTPLSNSSSVVFELYDSVGRQVKNESPGRWRLERNSEYRIRIQQPHLRSFVGSVNVEASNSNTWQPTTLGQVNTIPDRSREVFTLPNDSEVLSFIPVDDPSSGVYWRVFNQAGQVLFQGNSGRDVAWIKLPKNGMHYLEIDNIDVNAPFSFRIEASNLTTQTGALGQRSNVVLEERGDRVRLEYGLRRGQRLRWENIFPWDNWRAEDYITAFMTGPNGEEVLGIDAFIDSTHWLAKDDGIHTIEIGSVVDESQSLSLLLAEDPAPELDGGRSGFDMVYEGVLTRDERNEGVARFPFSGGNVSLLIDWLRSEVSFNFYARILGDQGPILNPTSRIDDHLIQLSGSESYTLELQLHDRFDSAEYHFILRNLATAPRLELGENVAEIELGPFESKLYKLQPVEPVDIELVTSNHNPSITIDIQQPFVATMSRVTTSQWPQTFAVGDFGVIVTSNLESETQVSFDLAIHEYKQPLSLDRANRVPLQVGANVFRFEAPVHRSRIVISNPEQFTNLRIIAPNGNEIHPDSSAMFVLADPGQYTLQIDSADVVDDANLMITSIPTDPVEYLLGEYLLLEGLVRDQQLAYSFQIPSDGVYVLRSSFADHFRLLDESGQRVALDEIPNDDFPRRIQYLEAGVYTLRFTVTGPEASLYIAGMNQLPEIGLGEVSGTLETDESLRVMRLQLGEGQDVLLESELGTSVFFLREQNDQLLDLRSSRLITSEEPQNLLFFVQPTGPEASDRNFQFEVTSAPEDLNENIEIDTRFDGELSPFQVPVLNFSLSEARNTVLIDTDYYGAQLRSPNGETRDLSTFNNNQPFFHLPAGAYQITGAPKSEAQSFFVHVQSFETAEVVSPANEELLPAGTLHQFTVDQPTTLLFRIESQSTDSLVKLWGATGEISINQNNRAALEPDTYWMQLRGHVDDRLAVIPIDEEITAGELGTRYFIDTDSSNDARIGYALSAGQLIDVSQLEIGNEAIAFYRIVPDGFTANADFGWSNIEQWTAPLAVDQGSKLEIRIVGIGSSAIQVVDVETGPLLFPLQEREATVGRQTRRLYWRLSPSLDEVYSIKRSSTATIEAKWYVIDSLGRVVHTDIPNEAALSFGTEQNYYLVFEPLTLPENDFELNLRLSIL